MVQTQNGLAGSYGVWRNFAPLGTQKIALRVQGPKTRALGPNVNGIWALNHYYLGPWTLKVVQLVGQRQDFLLPQQGDRFRD